MGKTSVTDLTVFDIDGMKCFEKDGVAYLHLETCARGLGFTRTNTIDGVVYTSVRWERVDRYLRELGVLAKKGKNEENNELTSQVFPHKWGNDNSLTTSASGSKTEFLGQTFVQNLHKNNFLTKSPSDEKNEQKTELTSQVFTHFWVNDNSLTNVRETFKNLKERPEFIPEAIFYKLAMKGNSEAAKAFQDKIAWEVIPSIRKRGYYSAYGSEAETIAAVVADMNDKDKRKTIIKALQEANIKQADFIREYMGERNMRIPPSIEAMSDRNASAKYLMRGWGDRKFSQRSMPEPYNTDWQITAYLKMMARSKVHGHHFVKFCGEYYFDKLGYMALIEKMYKNKKLKRDYAQAWYDAVDQL